MTTYVRTNNGATVHLADCRYAKPPYKIYPWKWAEGRTVTEIMAIASSTGAELHFCRICLPEVAA